MELGDALGPILWQFPPTRRFDPDAFATFLALLPAAHRGTKLRHVVEARHESFAAPEWFGLLRQHQVAAAIIESDKHALLGDLTAPFVYARLQHNAEAAPEGYPSTALDDWAERARCWAAGKPVEDLPLATPEAKTEARECFIFFISGDKVRAPDAAQAFIGRCRASPSNEA